MPTPPAEPSPAADPSQPSVPPQPLPPTPKQQPTKPTPSTTRKPRQRKRPADKQQNQQQPPPQPAAQPPTPVGQPQAYHTPRGPIFQPYPGSPYIMNPPYPMNGAPYGQHPQHPPQHGQPMNPAGPPPPQYGYPMHPGYQHPFPQYAQYPQPMMMYPPPRHEEMPEAPHPEPAESVSAPAGTKRKRKTQSQGGRGQAAERGSDDDTAASGSDIPRTSAAQQAQAASAADLKKRTKTQRACDSCRSRKIRCDVISDADAPVCQHCKQYGFECTFFLPITETRFKKKKLEEEAEKEKLAAAAAADSSKAPSRDAKRDTGFLGPTSAAHLLHSQATINPRVYESYDLRYQHTFEVSKGGDGLIMVQKPATDDPNLVHPKPSDLHIERDVIEKLVNAYFAEIAPILPIVTEAEFVATSNPPPILIYSMCLVAAAKRDVPQKIFESIRYMVNSILKGEDVLSTASIVNVQALLILCMSGDCHSQFVPSAISALWIRLGAAIRMAQDLGLHRAEAVRQDIEVRRRLWAACLICDRWVAIAYGFPVMIDLQDCDARLPSTGDATDVYMDELVRLSILLGRVQKTIYSPSGLTFTTDEMLHDLLADLQRWKDGLPEHLKYKGAEETSNTAGLLHLLYSCVYMMFWRVFMRISYSCPAHLKFAMTVEQWSELVKLTSECIDWLDTHEKIYDAWLIVAYAATSCALVQYHTFVRRKDEQAAAKLRKLRDCVRRWEAAISPEHMSTRRKTAEIITLLFEATQDPQLPLQAPVLNPTGGVKGKPPVMLDYKKDPSRPGGGIFIAQSKGAVLKDVSKDVVITGSDDESRDSEGEDEIPAAPTASGSSVSLPAANDDNDGARSNLSPSRNSAAPGPAVPKYARKRTLPPDAFEQSMFTARPAPNMDFGGVPITVGIFAGNPTQAQQQEEQAEVASGANAAPLVKLTPLTAGARGGHYMNVNPAMNLQAQAAGGNVQVMNVLDGAQSGTNLADFQMADNGFLEGLPGGMFDWGQWDTFFSRFGGNPSAAGASAQNPPSQPDVKSEIQPNVSAARFSS